MLKVKLHKMLKKKKILHIVEAMGGGVFTYIVELANGISEEFDVTIAFGIRKETPENYRDYFDDRVKLVKVKNFVRNVNPIKDALACVELRKIIKDTQPEIIHLHSSKAGALGRLVFTSSKYKMFYTPHGYSFLMEDVSFMKKNLYKCIETMCGKKNCTTVACGKGEYEESCKVSRKSTYISNGINTDKLDKILKRPVLKSEEHPFTVYTVGRIGYQKNPEMFNKIASLVPDVRFVWIGEGDMKKYLVADNILITGWVKGENALELAKSGDMFMLPSRWEGLPISLLEAMYMKKLCIVSDVVGNRDIIVDGKTGYICHSAEEFAETIKKARLTDNSDIIENAHNEIVNSYNSKLLCVKYKELYRGKK